MDDKKENVLFDANNPHITTESIISSSQKQGKKGGVGEHGSQPSSPTLSPKGHTQLRELNALVTKSKKVFFEAQTVFPFDLFPSVVTIDENKINIINRTFFKSESVVSLLLSDIRNVEIQTTPFFSTLRITTNSISGNLTVIKFLKRDDAARFRRIIEGLLFISKQRIDIDNIPPEEAVKKIEQLGAIHTQFN